ncbi:hypothetical protein AB1K70_15645 [Bremerella sp. JC770]|uniref:beta strand repeat-containing protein n=1 Tax=Bremerella sp. JC770 TaxID=3232137 RepID=UPI003457C458
MKKQTLWNRIFGQKSDKKAKAQPAFQEQFDTKLRFRELEPRVVLAADLLYDTSSNNVTINITGMDNETIEFGEAVDGKLLVTGIDSVKVNGDPAVAATSFNFDVLTLGTVTINDTSTGGTSTLLFDGVTDPITAGVDFADSISIFNVDVVTIEAGANVSVAGTFLHETNADDTDNNTVTFDGGLTADELHIVAEAGSTASTSVVDTSSGSVVVNVLDVQKLSATTMDLSVDLTNSANNDVGVLSGSGLAVEIAINDSVDDLEVAFVNATNLTLESSGKIFSTASGSLSVSKDASFTAATIELGESTNDFTYLTLESTGAVDIADAGGFSFKGDSSVGGALTIDTTGAITQEIGSSLVADSTASFTVGDLANIDLGLKTNQFNGTVAITGQNSRAGDVTLYDGDGDLQFGSVLAKNLTVSTAGNITQTTDAIDVLEATSLTFLNPMSTVDLRTGDNNFQGEVEVDGTVANLQSFHLRNVNATPSLGSLLEGRFAIGGMADISLLFETAASYDLPAINISGDLLVDVGGDINDQSGKQLIVSKAASFTATNIDLTNHGTGHDFNTLTLNASGIASVTETNGFSFDGESTIGGTLNVTTGGAIGQTGGKIIASGAATFNADANITLNQANDFQGTVNASSADAASGAVVINDSNGLILGSIVAKSLTATADGLLEDSSTASIINVTGLASFEGDSIDLTNTTDTEGHQLTEVTLNTTGTSPDAHAKLKEDGGFSFDGASDIDGNLTVTTTGGIGQASGSSLIVDGTTVLKVANNAAVTLNKSNNFKNAVSVDAAGAMESAGTVTLNDTSGGIVLGAIDAANLNVTSATNITQNSGVQVSGVSNFVVGKLSNVTLDDGANEFNIISVQASSAAASSVIINDSAGGITLAKFEANALDVTTVGEIQDSAGNEIIADVVRFDGGSLNLTNYAPGQDFNTINLTIDGDAKINEVNGFSFSKDNSVGGLLEVTTTGSVGQILGKLTVTGPTDITAMGSISLTEEDNNFTGSVSLAGTDIYVVDIDAIELGDITANSLKVDASEGHVAQEVGTVLQIATTTVVRAAENYNVLLIEDNQFMGSVSVVGFSNPTDVEINDVDGLIIGDVDAVNLKVTAGGDITQETDKSIIVTGMTSIEVQGNANIDLSNEENEFGSIQVNKTLGDYAGTVKVYDSTDDLELKDIWADVLEVTVENGAISQAAGTSVRSKTSISFDVDGAMVLGDITTPTLSLTSGGSIAQDGGTSLVVSGMTMIEVDKGENVDLSEMGNELGSISVNASSMPGSEVYAGTVTIFDGGNDDADMAGGTADDGLTLKDIWADMLVITTAGAQGHIDQQFAMMPDDTGIRVTGLTEIDVEEGVTVDLSSTLNELGSISVNASSMPGSEVYAGTVTIFDGGNDDADTKMDTADDGLTLGDIYAKNLNVTTAGTNGEVSQSGSLFVTLATSVEVDTDVNVDLSSADNQLTTISVFGSSMSAAGIVTIEDSTGSLELDDIKVGTLEVSTPGKITQTLTGVVVSGTSSFTVGDTPGVSGVNLSDSINNFFGDKISVSGQTGEAGHISIYTYTGDIKLGDIDGSSATIAAFGGKIWQSDDGVQLSGNAQFTVAKDADILLDSSDNNIFGGEVDLLGAAGEPNNVALKNSGVGLLLDQVEASGDLTIVTAGGITQTNAGATDYVQVGGTSSFTVSDDADILLGANTNNKFNTVNANANGTTGEAGTVSLYDGEGHLILGDIVAKNLTAVNGDGGDILDTAATAIEISELTQLTANNILLNTSNAKHQIDKLTLDAAGNANVVELDGFSFVGTNEIDSNLTINAGGDIDQPSGKMIVMGVTDLTVAEDADVSLDLWNDFLGEVNVVGADYRAGTVTLTSISLGGIQLGNIHAKMLNVNSVAAVGQTGDGLDVTAMTAIEVGDGINVDLSSTKNELGSISVNASNALVMAGMEVYAGTVTVFDGSNDNADMKADTADDGLTLKDIWADMLVVTTAGEQGHIDQQFDKMPDPMGEDTGIRVTGMTKIEVEAGVDVTLSSELNKLGSISVNESNSMAMPGMEIYAGNVEVFDSENNNTDGKNNTWDDGLTLKDVWADMLMVTTEGGEGHIDQEVGSGIRVADMVKIEVDKAVNVDLSSTLNKLNSIAVNESNTMVTPGMEVFAGTVTIFDNFNDDADATENTWDDGVYLKDIWANILTVRSDANISQFEDTLLTVMTQTNLSLGGEGSITLLNDGDSEECEDLDPATGNDLSADVNVELDDLAFLKNFEILNVNAGADLPGQDFGAAVNNGTVTNLTLKYTQAPVVTLSGIDILGDLWIESGDDIRQSAAIFVDLNATFIGQQIHLATTGVEDLNVTGNATFQATSGEIEVGVTPLAIDAWVRGKDSGADVQLGTTTFHADSLAGHVTITQDNQMTLVNSDILFCDKVDMIGNVAQSAVLTSMTGGIGTSGVVDVTVHDLTTLKASSNIVLGDSGDSNVDLRIVYINKADATNVADVSIYEQNDANGLAVVDGTTISGTLAIQTAGHIVQVDEFRTFKGVLAHDNVVAGKGLLVSEKGGVLLTSVDFDSLAASAVGTLFVTQGAALDFGTAGIADADGFGGNLTTDAIDSFLPTDNEDTFAKAARADAFEDGAGEDYSMVIGDVDGLRIEDVADATGGDVTTIEGLRTKSSAAGHVFVRAEGGDLTFDAGAGSGMVVGLANSGVITALASGNMTIVDGSWLSVTDGTNPDGYDPNGPPSADDPFALVSTLEDFIDNPADPFELDNTLNPNPNQGPAYSRIPGNFDTYLLDSRIGIDAKAVIELTQLGTLAELDMMGKTSVPGELDFEVVIDYADTTAPQVVSYDKAFDTTEIITHDIPWEFARTKNDTTVTLEAYNSPQINLFDNVVAADNFNNLNVVVDQFVFFFQPIEPYVPEINDFVRPSNPIYAMPVIYDPTPTPYASLTEIADATRVATQIDSVTVVEVDPENREMEIGEEIELDDDFMTLDAVKDYIQDGDQFPPGLYKIEILYPGTEVPEQHFYWKQDRPDPFDLFSQNIRPIAPQAAELAAADRAEAQLSAEEVWAREYDKWFPSAADGQSADDLLVPAAESESSDMIPSEDDILIERVTTVSLQEIDRMTDRLRAKRSIVRDSLNGAMIGGAALMAAVAAQGRKDDEAPNDQAEENRDQPEESLDGTSLNRLRRRVRQWL